MTIILKLCGSYQVVVKIYFQFFFFLMIGSLVLEAHYSTRANFLMQKISSINSRPRAECGKNQNYFGLKFCVDFFSPAKLLKLFAGKKLIISGPRAECEKKISKLFRDLILRKKKRAGNNCRAEYTI